MKHTDWAIVFSMILIGFVIMCNYETLALRQIQNQTIMYNDIFDTAVRDALRNGLSIDKEYVYINKDKVRTQFFEGIGEIIRLDESVFPIMLVTNQYGYTIWVDGRETVELYEGISTEMKINSIRKAVEDGLNSSAASKNYGVKYKISIPYNDMNEWYNTIGDMGLLVIFQGNPMYGNRKINRYIVSGASFEELSVLE